MTKVGRLNAFERKYWVLQCLLVCLWKKNGKRIAGDKGLEKLAVVPYAAVGGDSLLEQSLGGSIESPRPPDIHVKR